MDSLLLGDSLAAELSALTRAALVRIQVPQPGFIRPGIHQMPVGFFVNNEQANPFNTVSWKNRLTFG